MKIPIIYKKSNSFIKLILVSILVTFIIIVVILLSPQLLNIVEYNSLVAIIISVLISHFIFVLLFIFQKKYKTIGLIDFNNDTLYINQGQNKYTFSYSEIIYLNIFIHSKSQLNKKNIFIYNDGTGNFISIQLNERTLVYEILLKDEESIKKIELFIKEKLIGYCIDNEI